jgi:hypothetical protein
MGSLSFDETKITIKPDSLLTAGQYTLTLQKDSLQNYGGIRIEQDVTFIFTVIETEPCLSTRNFSLITDDFSSEALHQKTSQHITANNKITNSAQITYDAKSYIILFPSFEAKDGAVFQAVIGGCD